ncbi:MAG TPA: alpha/beta hydrolase [Rhizomicrobium sp.]|nr:alpha/beta hydrolase [Rhizomicrobium sp.]
MQFKTATVKGVEVFYREAGDRSYPKLLLLHGFPTSSHQYRELIPALENHFHIIAPDLPGFGLSPLPDGQPKYTSAYAATVLSGLLQKLGFTRFGLFVQGHAGPVGLHLLEHQAEWVDWLIIQNADISGNHLTAAWRAVCGPYWLSRSADTEKAVSGYLKPEMIRQIYTQGHENPAEISPDNWNMDAYFLERPTTRQAQLDLLYDHRTAADRYPHWRAMLRERQPKTLVFWGRDDIFFAPAGADAFVEDIPGAEIHRLKSGHFAVNDNVEFVARKMIGFHWKHLVD